MFQNEIHKERFVSLSNKLIKENHITFKIDAYYSSLFYIISSNKDLFNMNEKIFDFKNRSIKSDVLNDEALTGTTRRLLSLGFELFTNRSWGDMSIIDIFDYLDEYSFEVAIIALRLRFNQL